MPELLLYFRHRVPTDKIKLASRFSLSFRRLIPVSEPVDLGTVSGSGSGSPVKAMTAHFEKLQESPSAATISKAAPSPNIERSSIPVSDWRDRNLTVLFGTSITDRIQGKWIAGPGKRCTNVSKSGARIADISRMVDNFYQRNVNTEVKNVEKIILSFGTNEVKHETGGVAKFEQPILDLLRKVRKLFPDSTVYVQSVLPTRNVYWYCTPNLLDFNSILKAACLRVNCTFVDLFWDFLAPEERVDRFSRKFTFWDCNKKLFWDHYHLNRFGQQHLCRWFWSIINYDTFGMKVIEHQCC